MFCHLLSHKSGFITYISILINLLRLLRAKGYNIVRRDIASGGGGLVFLIRDFHFQRLPDIGNESSDLKYLGNFNAKNTTWDSIITNAGSSELSNLVNDKIFLSLNDGTHTFRSYSYGSTEVLDLTFISPGLLPYSFWRVLDNIGSDHLPILVETALNVNRTGAKNLHWNFRKADWSLKISLTILYRKNLFRTTWKRNGPTSGTPFLQLIIHQSLAG
ncbi:RNA-directed DNA polymerase from mobile element jockey [Trichonephila inaurata madagascariensis]|uniref:RNA-directed DNA polymerase from mobile element jockey n=1 Tax=Trichonephila inaurata madagascariensis TaxID=2747483 RepID=A0A8X6XZK8_9ARAC|nr:RNA-directed DNA polymerase from mobile element jockey [Trichonephila inaurata madagascariensis]